MKFLKKIVILVLIAIPLVVALFLKKEYAVQREIEINKPRNEVFEYVKYFKKSR